MSEESKSGIAWLTHERSLAFEKMLDDTFENHRYFDFRITPQLLPALTENGEDAFRWQTSWECEVGMPDDVVLKENDLSEEQKNAVGIFVKELGWHFVQDIKGQTPVPWEGSHFNLTSYQGHPSWKYVDDHPVKQGLSYSYTIAVRSKRRIVGVLQVKDADMSVSSVIKNCLPFVDWLIVLDNNSTDGTSQEIAKMASTSDKILTKRILTVNSGGRYLNALCGTDTFVMKIDADEFWNPTHSHDIRNALINSDCYRDASRSIPQIDLNGIDLDKGVAVGKPCHAFVYYFGNILAWCQGPERLHGEPLTFRKNCAWTNHKVLEKKREDGTTIPSVIHLPFLDMCSLTREDMRPMVEAHKSGYVVKNAEDWVACHLEDYDIEDTLKKILRGKTMWTLGDTHPHLV